MTHGTSECDRRAPLLAVLTTAIELRLHTRWLPTPSDTWQSKDSCEESLLMTPGLRRSKSSLLIMYQPHYRILGFTMAEESGQGRRHPLLSQTNEKSQVFARQITMPWRRLGPTAGTASFQGPKSVGKQSILREDASNSSALLFV